MKAMHRLGFRKFLDVLSRPLMLVVASAVGVLILVVVGLKVVLRPAIPQSVISEAPFAIFYPKPGGHIMLQKDSYKYSPSTKQLSFVATYEGHRVVYGEQPTPDQFNDIPEYYPKLIEKLNGYGTVENMLGKFNLTRPTEVKHQVAVAYIQGTLMFIQSDDDLSNDQWRRLLATMKTVQGERS
jgi:hypothetical protein